MASFWFHNDKKEVNRIVITTTQPLLCSQFMADPKKILIFQYYVIYNIEYKLSSLMARKYNI